MMEQNDSGVQARKLMMEFADQTGLSPGGKAERRYLWTDAFAVCNFLGMYRLTGDAQYRDLALLLVDQVHYTLGRHRDDDARKGWISGLGEREARLHPTRGGLRIGKGTNERRPGEPFDEQREWDRDGQYYHYLTKWMHALNRVAYAAGDPAYNRWAVELAKAAHATFTYAPVAGGQKSMYWKMSIDLSYPLVASMGHHDPLDGLITDLQLQAAAAKDADTSDLDLSAEVADMARMCEGKSWTTDDSLGIGELLGAAYRLAQLIVFENVNQAGLLEIVLDSSLASLRSFGRRGNPLQQPAGYRLAFRELGLCIGLEAVERLRDLIEEIPYGSDGRQRLHSTVDGLMEYAPLGDGIRNFWLDPANRKSTTWKEHADINAVMLATGLAPDGYLELR